MLLLLMYVQENAHFLATFSKDVRAKCCSEAVGFLFVFITEDFVAFRNMPKDTTTL